MTSNIHRDEHLRLLLIEDNPGDARLVREYLSEGGSDTDVRWEKSLREGLEAVRREEPDLLLVDLNLPDSEGLETVRSVVAADGLTPTVVLTGLEDEELGRAAVREGAQDYLVKGDVTPAALLRTIRYALLRSRADREIRRHQRRFQALISNVSDVISVIAPDGTVLYQSPSLERVLGHAPEELEGENILEYFHPDDRERVRRELQEMARAPSSERIAEARFRHADGSWRVLEAYGRMPPEGTDIGGLIVVSRDVTERVRRERELQQATASLRERVKEQSCLYDVSRFLHADERELAERLQAVVDRMPDGWQYPAVTAVRLQLWGRVWTSGDFPEDASTLSTPIAVDGGEPGRIEVCYREERPAEDIGPFITEERRLLEAIAEQIGVALDRRRTRRELETERQRLAEVFRNAPAWVATLRGPEHVFEMANPAYFELVGDREVVGRPVREVFPELDETGYFELLDRVYDTGETVEVDEQLLELETDGGTEEKYISFVYQPRREEGEVVGVIAHGVDVTEEVARRKEAEEREEKLQKVFDTSADGILLADTDGNFTFANPRAEEMLGLEKGEIAARTYNDPKWGITDPEGGEFADEELPVARVLRTGEPVRGIQHGVERPDGTRRVLSVNAAPLYGSESDLQGVVASLRDVTDQRRRQEALRESEARYRTLVETMAEATAILDRDGRITFANTEAEELLGLERSELAERTYDDPDWEITGPDGGPFPEHELPFRRVMDTGRPVRNVEHGIVRPDGTRRILAVNAAPLGEDPAAPDGVVATLRDVTDRKRMEAELRHRALHDPLTGLANRSLFRDRLEQALARAKRDGGTVGLLVLDVDRFKGVNDALGHTAGDRLLQELARRMEDRVRDPDTVARLGGDEFAVIVPDVASSDELGGVTDRITESLGRPFLLGGEEVVIDVTVGGVLAGDPDVETAVPLGDPEDVVRYADLALYRAKERSGSSVHLFRPREDRSRAQQLGREQELRRAIRREEFEVHFQPIVRLEEGAVWGMEPLARWRHPERGMVSPGEFIPLAEETGLIHDLGELIFRRTCRHVADWPETAAGAPNVTANLSGRQFDRDGLEDMLSSAVDKSGLDPSRFWLEITESAITRATGRIDALRRQGFAIFVDDFGTGYSSFHYLRDLELDGLKIDMSFVHGLDGNPKGRGLVETMVTMGRTLEMSVVAEGIETPAQREVLRELGCSLGQGYLFAHPMPAGEVAGFLGER